MKIEDEELLVLVEDVDLASKKYSFPEKASLSCVKRGGDD